nr:sm-like protein LSM2 [Tanacetum cinerariifolium]
MLFFSYFKDLVGREVTVELKNDLAIRGTLHSVDQYLNIKLENTRVVDQDKYPHMSSSLAAAAGLTYRLYSIEEV